MTYLSGLGELISISFAKEGANIAINYFNRVEPAQKVQKACEAEGVKAVVIKAVCNSNPGRESIYERD